MLMEKYFDFSVTDEPDDVKSKSRLKIKVLVMFILRQKPQNRGRILEYMSVVCKDEIILS